jgi:MSHA biogenesis protein MshO
MPAAPYGIAQGDNIIIYNLGPGFAGADAYADGAANRAIVGAVNVNTKIISLPAGSFAGAQSSPGNRFIVAGAPVTFACINNANGTGTLTRFSNYNFRAAQVDPAPLGATAARMASNVLGCTFSVQQQANQNTALIGLAIALARPNPGSGGNGLETITLAQQINVNNTP